MASLGVRARAVVRIPCEDVDLMAGLILSASLVRRRAAVDVIQFRVRQNAWLWSLCHFAHSLLSWCGRLAAPQCALKAWWRI